MAEILVVDDERTFREALVESICDLGHSATAFRSIREALPLISSSPFDAIFVDYRMPDIDGLTAIKLIQQTLGEATPPIVMITAHFDSRNTIEAMKLGAFDHLTKPVGRLDIERVLQAIFKAYPGSEDNSVRDRPVESANSLIGNSEEMRAVLKMVGRVSQSSSTVLLLGETGTGKEVVARTLHENSSRSHGPFTAINCAAIPEALLESELFGHTKGSFTGAIHDRRGSFQLSEGGTLFLDEIGDMNLTLQAKILRALQEREILPVGSSKPVKFDARIVAATHRNLKSLVEKGSFREDLFFRLNVIQIVLPPLRERKGDVEALAEHFLLHLGSPPKRLTNEAKSKLVNYSWPGNVRELKNVIERAVVIAPGQIVSDDDIRFLNSDPAESRVPTSLDLPQAIAKLEKTMISETLKLTEGNRSEAARRLGIQRQALYAKIKEHQIDV